MKPKLQAFGPWAVTVCAMLMIVAIPLVLNPSRRIASDPLRVFYTPKFEVLMALSAVLLVAVLVAALVDRKQPEVPVLLPALAFLNISALSALLSGSVGISFVGERYDGLLSLAAEVSLFYATARFLDSWVRMRAFLMAGVAAAVVVSTYGILQSFGLTSGLAIPWFSVGRASSTVGQPVHLAAYLTLAMGATLALYFLAGRRWERGLWLAALALVGACWLYANTRGAMLGVGLALPIVLLLAYRRLGSIRPLLPPLLVLAVAMLASQLLSPQSTNIFSRFLGANPARTAVAQEVLPAKPPQDGDPQNTTANSAAQLPGPGFVNLTDHTGGSNLAQKAPPPGQEVPPDQAPQAQQPPQVSPDTTLRTRLLIWRDTIPMILARPILGYGPDNFRRPFRRYEGADLELALQNNGEYADKAHNEFLQVAATTGLLGLAAYLWVFVAYFRGAYRRGGWVLLALSGGVLAYILQLQTAFTTITNGVTFWAILGVSVAVMRIQDRETADAAPGGDR